MGTGACLDCSAGTFSNQTYDPLYHILLSLLICLSFTLPPFFFFTEQIKCVSIATQGITRITKVSRRASRALLETTVMSMAVFTATIALLGHTITSQVRKR